jgi:predicted tellurium resistance membrane protein TerC
MFYGIDTARLVGVLVALHVFGWAYNALVAWMEREGRDRGYTAILVIIGNLVTVAAMAWITGLDMAVLMLAGFAASGLPMTLGSWWRHTQERKRQEQAMRDQALRLLERVE